ncbi:MAG: glucose 1-dehydrogenase [Woeseiaceae bacterium]|nr:glucose 1-dehydrogenase [Woeseiaceae bacterium]
MSNFAGKVVLITGAASGFGRLLAEKLAARGAKLALGDLNADGVKAVAAALDAPCIAGSCDVRAEQQVADFVAKTVSEFGRIDIAINNAGIGTPLKSLVETTEEDMDINFAVNAKGVFFGMKYQIPAMLEQGGGAILNVASMAGIHGAYKMTPYVAAKHAVVGITKTAALEYARNNVRVNAICPYFSPTPLVTEGIDPEVQAMVANGAPMKRLGTPEEMVDAMLHIVDPDNSYMTGQAIAVDGGVSAI